VSLSPLQQLFQWRRSVRRYEDRAVGDAELLSLLEAARGAPSAENAQPWRFVVVRDPEARARLARACFSGIFSATRFAAQAPVVIALCAERLGLVEAGKSVKDGAMYQLDCGIAGEHIVLRAAELGLGTCWIGWFNRRAARRTLGAPFHVQVVALIAVGYPVQPETPRPRPRKPLSSIAWLDRWGNDISAMDAYEGSEK
jgi:nitroreductase